MVNFDAGAETPAAGAFTTIGIALAALALTPLLHCLPNATLAATLFLTLGVGVEIDVSAGIALSILLYLCKISTPHTAEVSLVPGTEHFRNVKRHAVLSDSRILTLRIDESLHFAHARHLEDVIYDRVAADHGLKHVILMGSAINEIDSSALESLEAINQRLNDLGVVLHLSEVKSTRSNSIPTFSSWRCRISTKKPQNLRS